MKEEDTLADTHIHTAVDRALVLRSLVGFTE